MKHYFLVFSVACVALFAESTNNTQDLIIEKSSNLYENQDSNQHIDTSTQTPLNDVFIPVLGPGETIKDVLDVYRDNEGVLNLKELLDKAKDNYTLQAKDIAIQSAEATRASVYGNYLPSLDVGYSFNSTKRNTTSWQPSTSNHSANATLNWVLFDGAAREFSLLSNNALVRAAIADKGYSQETLFLQVISAYYDYFTLKGQIIAMEQKRVNIAANVARIQVLYEAGLETIDAIEALKAELSLTEYQLESLKLNFEQIKLQLSLFTNTDINKLKLASIDDPQYKTIQSLNITMQQEQAQSVEHQIGTLTYWPSIAVFDTFTWNFKTSNLSSNPLASFSYPKE